MVQKKVIRVRLNYKTQSMQAGLIEPGQLTSRYDPYRLFALVLAQSPVPEGNVLA